MSLRNERKRLAVRDPAGETYGDGSFDTLVEAEWPATYPDDATKVSVHLDGCDFDLGLEELRALQDQLPRMLGWLGDRPKP